MYGPGLSSTSRQNGPLPARTFCPMLSPFKFFISSLSNTTNIFNNPATSIVSTMEVYIDDMLESLRSSSITSTSTTATSDIELKFNTSSGSGTTCRTIFSDAKKCVEAGPRVETSSDSRSSVLSSLDCVEANPRMETRLKFNTSSDFDTTCGAVPPDAKKRVVAGPRVETSSDSRSSALSSLDCAEAYPRMETSSGSRSSVGFDRDIGSTKRLMLDDFDFVRRLGSGDIGTVYLVERRAVRGCYFAAKVMDREELAYRNKEGRAGTEREILEMLDHPFLPSLYATLNCPKWSCLLTEFCPGGDLHVLRQRQPEKRFDEDAVRFYASEVVAALEYLHMLGIIYRDLKPENILVRSDGHIMLTDFDLSLKCHNSTPRAHIIYDQPGPKPRRPDSTRLSISSCILPRCGVPGPVKRYRLPFFRARGKGYRGTPKIVAEPIDARSMSFVGTHEYLAPEIVSGEGHGNAVDWWTLGVLMYELFYGTTPFRGKDNGCTLASIVARGLEFPAEPAVPDSAKDLMGQLLDKDPTRRMGSMMGATAVKHHGFFGGVNWALLRCMEPPYVPGGFGPSDHDHDHDQGSEGNVDCY